MHKKNSAAYLFLFFFLFSFLSPGKLFSQDDDPTVITVMVVYTENAKDWADENEGGIDNVIGQGIALTNQIMVNSTLNVEVVLAHAALVDYNEMGAPGEDLGRLSNPNDGYMDEIHQWRDIYNADMVKLLSTDTDKVCGRSMLPRYPNPKLAFSHTKVWCASSSTFAHELGHNFGLNHSRNQKENAAGPDGGMFEYSTGWQWMGDDDKGYISVMSYTQSPNFNTRAPHFSNPDISYKGGQTGSYTGTGSPADNARSLREVKEYLAGYRGPTHERDSLAVVILYENTNGENWDDDTNWFTNAPLRNWKGIESLALRIFNLDLSHNNLVGSLPSEIGDLEVISELYLSENQISGSIPKELWNLSYLRLLDLSNNELIGSIPQDIKGLSSLEWLDLSDNNLSGAIPSEISNLSKLETIWLDFNNITGNIPDEVWNIPNLSWIDLRFNNLSGEVSPKIGNLSNLSFLQLGNNNLSGFIPEEIGLLKKLWWLDLSDNNFKGNIPKKLGLLTNLDYLNLSNNQLSGAIPTSFSNLTKVTQFFFQDTYLCIPEDEALQSWLQNIESVTGTDVHCNDVRPDVVQITSPGNNSENLPFTV